MNNKPILFLCGLLLTLNVVAAPVEYVCWQQGSMPGFAYESSSVDCGGGKTKEAGTVSETVASDKKIVCLLPAACVALTPKVRQLLQRNVGVDTPKGLSKLTSSQILMALNNSEYMGRYSFLSCEGKGKITHDTNQITKGKLSLDEAKCPTVTDCANANQVFYNMAGVTPATMESAGIVQPEVKQVPAGTGN